ncbi:nitroreductase family deazaflavin-dependent oxidoreductase [Mycobacteroides chelonae]|uniref:nitroreductase family deazaflavin-dependent oxidoreductase n=1 Tax=Mycobacteroides TaxID=670516 RepID=UPI0009942EDB|nr:nitroreductase family deazaflavin-dependent oxidoreductase [Mycobacteroides chelonae]
MLIALILIVAAVPLALFTLLVVGIRMQIPAILNAVRRFNRAVTNPRVMTTAGTASTSTAVIHHTGRNSGRAYETPVEAFDTHENTVLILLPYGANADWVRNVIAQGGAEMIRAGETLRLTNPRVVRTAEVRTQLPAKELRMQRIFNVPDCLQLSRP